MYLEEFEKNEELNLKVQTVLLERHKLIDRLNHLKGIPQIYKKRTFQDQGEGFKRYRRVAEEIIRLFDCPIPNCGKNYGT
jgi:hypothetical protein